MNDKSYVWYLGYGSNIGKQRFLCYIIGGTPLFGQSIGKGCFDRSLPIADKFYNIPYNLYFALPGGKKETGNWGAGGVAFIKPYKEVNQAQWSLGRMWKITRKQYEEVKVQEGRAWYNYEILLGEDEGIPIYTITNSVNLTNILPPSEAYLKTIILGLKDTCQITNEEIVEYLITKEGCKDKYSKKELMQISESMSLKD